MITYLNQDDFIVVYLLYIRDSDGVFRLEEIFTHKTQAEAWAREMGYPVPSPNAYIRERQTVPHDDRI